MSEQNDSPSTVQVGDTESGAVAPDAVISETEVSETGASETVAPDAATSTEPSAPSADEAPATDPVGTTEQPAGQGGPESAESTGDVTSGDGASKGGDDEDGGDEDGGDEVSELDTEAEVAADFLEELLDIADLDGDIDTYIENGRAQVSIVTDSQTLAGKDGEVLEALQEIVRLAVMAETDNRTRLMLDVAGFRDKRRTTLRALASDAVQEVRDSGEPVRLAPMNPFERKIVHDTVAEAGLSSESEGTEPQRRVVVLPAS